jgi:hypothetical protein
VGFRKPPAWHQLIQEASKGLYSRLHPKTIEASSGTGSSSLTVAEVGRCPQGREPVRGLSVRDTGLHRRCLAVPYVRHVEDLDTASKNIDVHAALIRRLLIEP